MAEDFVGVKVLGLAQLSRDIKKADSELVKEIKKEAKVALTDLVKPAAERRVPVGLTGKLKKSIRVSVVSAKASLMAGRKTVPYANPIHWGWPSRGIAKTEFLTEAIYEKQDKIEGAYFRVVDRLLARTFTKKTPTT